MDEDRIYEQLITFNPSQFTALRRRLHLSNAHFSPNATPAELADEVIKQFKQRGDDLAKLAAAAFSVDQENVAVHELHGEVFSIENGEQSPKFFRDVQVSIREFGASCLTNDQGLFRIGLPAHVLPGQEVTLRHDKKRYAICSPLLGKQLIPADLTRLVEVRMLPEGSKLFWTHERIEEFIARVASESARKPPVQPGESADLSASILELGRHYGFSTDEVRKQIGMWMEAARKDVTDFRKQGMVAFAEKNFRLAGENFRRSAEEGEQQAADKLRASAADRELAGDAFYNALDYHQALQEYRRALTSLNTFKDSLGPLGIETYPEHTVDVRRITRKSANAKVGLGERVSGPDSRRYLEESVREYQGLIDQVSRSSNSQDWARTQNNLGSALAALGQRQGGPEGQRRLVEAVEAFRNALTVYTRDDLPQVLGHDPEQPGQRARGPGRAAGRAGGPAAAGRGGRGLPQRPHRLHPRRPAPVPGPRPRTTWAARSRP